MTQRKTREDVVEALQTINFPSFAGWNLRGADLSGLDLHLCSFCDADLRDVDFSDAILAGANLKGANILGVILRDTEVANIQGVTLQSIQPN